MYPAGLLSELALWLALPLALLILVTAVRGINWTALRQRRGAQHFFFGSVVVIALLWSLHAGIRPGLNFHLLGLTSVTLLMGWRLALLAGALAQLLLMLTGKLWWAALPYQFLLSVAVPVLCSYAFWSLVWQRMPHNPFVYILVAGFLNAALAQGITDLAQGLSLWAQGIYSLKIIWHDFLRYLPLMMFPEGVVNGMFITGMVVFHSRWLSTFDDDSYFR